MKSSTPPFLSSFYHEMENLAQAVVGGVHAHPLSHVQSCSVRSSWIGSFTGTFHFYIYVGTLAILTVMPDTFSPFLPSSAEFWRADSFGSCLRRIGVYLAQNFLPSVNPTVSIVQHYRSLYMFMHLLKFCQENYIMICRALLGIKRIQRGFK